VGVNLNVGARAVVGVAEVLEAKNRGSIELRDKRESGCLDGEPGAARVELTSETDIEAGEFVAPDEQLHITFGPDYDAVTSDFGHRCRRARERPLKRGRKGSRERLCLFEE
jgi:hypothetical protein